MTDERGEKVTIGYGRQKSFSHVFYDLVQKELLIQKDN